MDDAQPYLQLFNLCSDQYIIGAGGAVGLNFLAVDKLMSYLGVDEDERLDFYEKVRYINSIVLNEQHKEREASRKKK